MKKSVFISIILIVFILLSSSSFAALKATANITQSATSQEKGKYVTCTFNVNIAEGTANAFEGYLKYDKDFFEDVTVTSSYGLENKDKGYSETNGYIGIVSIDPIANTLFTVKLKVKEDTAKQSGQIKIENALVDNGTDEVQLSSNVITVNLKESSGTANEETAPEQNPSGESQNPPIQENDSEQTNDEKAEEEYEVIKDDNKEDKKENTTNKTTQADKVLPKAGLQTVYLGIGIFTITTIISLMVLKIKYKFK